MIVRAWSTFEVKSVNDDERSFEGIASTPSTDRMDDIVEPLGAEFKLPIPLKWQHGKGAIKDPVGWVHIAKPSSGGISVKCSMAKIDFPESLKNQLDECWAKVKAKLMRGFSIGFRGIDGEPIKGTFGFRYTKWEWLELSVVDIPANAEATILSIKSFDSEALAASGQQKRTGSVRLDNSNRPGVSGLTKGNPMTIKEQITAFETKRAALDARLTAIMEKSGLEGRSLDAAESEEYDGVDAELKECDAHLVRLRAREKQLAAQAVAVPGAAGTEPAVAAASRDIRRSSGIQATSNMPKGIGVARMAIAMYKAAGSAEVAAQIAKRLWPDNPELELTLRTGVDAGDTTTSGWASQLVPAAQQMMNEFLDLLRAATIMGRIPGLRKVPFNVAVPVMTGGGSFNWVGEAAGKPVTSQTFTSVTLRWAKAAGIIVITEELARFSSPSAELIIRDDMVKGLTRFFDAQFVGTGAEVSNVSPAGILNGISPTATTGTSAATFRTDMNNMLNNFTANHVDPSGIVLLMSATQALALSLMVTDLGVPLFPNINTSGGSILGFPTIVSEAVGAKIIALNAQDILVAEDSGIRVDVSREASVEMETTPAVGEQSPLSSLTNLKSLWQNNLVGFRVERYITWKRGRDSAVEYIDGNAYVPS